jgi:hypothetical protein
MSTWAASRLLGCNRSRLQEGFYCKTLPQNSQARTALLTAAETDAATAQRRPDRPGRAQPGSDLHARTFTRVDLAAGFRAEGAFYRGRVLSGPPVRSYAGCGRRAIPGQPGQARRNGPEVRRRLPGPQRALGAGAGHPESQGCLPLNPERPCHVYPSRRAAPRYRFDGFDILIRTADVTRLSRR